MNTMHFFVVLDVYIKLIIKTVKEEHGAASRPGPNS